MPPRQPSSQDQRLARRLLELRKAAGLTGDSVAAKTGWSPSKVSRVEHLRTGITVDDVTILLDLYDVEGPDRAEVIDLAERSGRPPAAAADALRDEAIAADLWGPSLIPAPLRTAEYARAVAESAQDITDMLPSEVEKLAGASRAWQRRIEARRDPLEVRAVVDATALRRRVGGNDVMHRQVAHLAALDGLPNVTLRVVPIDAAAPAGFGAFTLLRFGRVGGMTVPDVALFDDAAQPRDVDSERVTWRCRRAMRELAAAAEQPAAAIAAALAHWSR